MIIVRSVVERSGYVLRERYAVSDERDAHTCPDRIKECALFIVHKFERSLRDRGMLRILLVVIGHLLQCVVAQVLKGSLGQLKEICNDRKRSNDNDPQPRVSVHNSV